MSAFVYQAIGGDGRRVEGEVEARSRGDALRLLEKSRLQPLSVKLKEAAPAEGAAAAASSFSEPAKAPTGTLTLNSKQLINFTDEISDLLDAGLQLEPALRLMEQRRELSSLKGVVVRLRNQVREGINFSTALRATSPSFDELYCRLVSAGEVSGALPQILRRQALYLGAMNELRNRVIQALIYPAILIGVGSILMGVFMTVLVPQLTDLFTKTGQQLPFLTRALIAFSYFIGHWWWLLILIAFGAVAAFKQAISRPGGRFWWDRKRLKLPLVGAVVISRYYVQLAQTLATMIANGIPLLNALRLMHAATENRYLNGLLGRVVEIVSEGGSFSRAMVKVGEFPATFIDMIAVGEQTGDLSAALEKTALRYDKELNVKIQRLTAIIQPAIVVVMAGTVGVVAYSMITGIFQTISGLKTH